MPAKITPKGYSRLQIALHWLVFALIAQQYIFKEAIAAAWGRLREGLELGFDPLVLAHVLGGALVLVFALWRLMLRARRGVPPAIEVGKLQSLLGKITHGGLYALMILMPLSGALAWFGGVEAAAQGHDVMKIILLALVGLHVLAVPFHRIVLKNKVMSRMIRPET